MVHPFLANQASARVAAFALREAGVSQVIDELFNFRACDLYVHDEPALIGHTFGEVVDRYVRARPLGRVRPTGDVELNPAPDTRFEPGDRLAVLAQDRTALELAEVDVGLMLEGEQVIVQVDHHDGDRLLHRMRFDGSSLGVHHVGDEFVFVS